MTQYTYYVKDEDLPRFVMSHGIVFISMYEWAYTKSGTARDGKVKTWMVISSNAKPFQ